MPNLRDPMEPDDYGFVLTEVDEEPARCEADHTDGGVCLRILNRDGFCPSPEGHVADLWTVEMLKQQQLAFHMNAVRSMKEGDVLSVFTWCELHQEAAILLRLFVEP